MSTDRILVQEIKIVGILPCLADPEKIRFHAVIDTDISEVLPYLNRALKAAIYNHQAHTLTIVKEGRLITLYPRQVTAGKIQDEKDARQILDWLKNFINETYQKRETMEPDYQRHQRLGVLEIYKLLPGINCRECGQASCLSFAVKLCQEEVEITKCKRILLADYTEKRKMLFTLLKDSGYLVPQAFHQTDEGK